MVRPLRNIDRTALSKPLTPGTVVHTNQGSYNHDDIIGKPKRMYLTFAKSNRSSDPAKDKFLVTEPTLEEFVALAPRRAQPIYASDAAVAVSLAEIDVEIPEITPENHSKPQTPVNILEAGSGNGSLTLLICRAIHGANSLARHYNDPDLRGAVLHSLDCNRNHQRAAMNNVRLYKRGRFEKDVEFDHCELPQHWLELPQNATKQFQAAFLDLPDPHLYLAAIAAKMNLDSTLVVFVPSVTQLVRCKHELISGGIDLSLVRTVELPPGYGGGVREWDLATTRVRATGELSDICRPKVGVRVVGGGFLGIFKRKTVDGTSKYLDDKD